MREPDEKKSITGYKIFYLCTQIRKSIVLFSMLSNVSIHFRFSLENAADSESYRGKCQVLTISVERATSSTFLHVNLFLRATKIRKLSLNFTIT